MKQVCRSTKNIWNDGKTIQKQ